jgi:beta-N-acetylhexosaminidase
MTNRQKIGQRFAAGFSGTKVSSELRRLIQEYKIGNVILFGHNLESTIQAKALTREIQELIQAETGYPAFIAIDQEGGTVVRLPDDMVNVPGTMALTASGNPENAAEAARITAAELRRIGINCNLAPVLDINCNPDNPVIGNRSFSPRAQEAASYAVAAIRSFGEAGLFCCGKHFPGHGDTSIDSHLDLPMINLTLEELEQRELVPFKAAIEAGIPAIMTSHILFPKIETEKLPATMSSKFLKDLLREKLKFDGLILSDGMEMNAIQTYYGIPRGCVMALSAGVDMVFVCHEMPEMEKSLKEINAIFEHGGFDTAEFDTSVERILRYKEKYAVSGNIIDDPAQTALRMAHNNILMRNCLATGQNELPESLGEKPFFAGSLAYRSTIASTAPDKSMSISRWFAKQFNGNFLETPVNPAPQEIDAIMLDIPKATSIVFGSYNGHLNRGQIELAKKLNEIALQNGIPFICMASRNPWDLNLMPPEAHTMAIWEYTEKSFKAAAAALRGEFVPAGKLP